MKKLIEAILQSKIGKAVLSLILLRFLAFLKDRGAAVHGGAGVYIVKFIDDLEPTLLGDFLDSHDPAEVHQTLTDNGVKDDTKKKGFLSGLLGSDDSTDTEETA